MRNSYSIRVSSQKGGVGKTTVAINLAVALSMHNYKVLLIDADMISPSVGFFMGMENANVGIRDVIDGKVDAKQAIIRHNVSGVDVIPGTQRLREFPNIANILGYFNKIRASNTYDFIITDTAPGYWFPEFASIADEAIIVSTMTMASISSAMRFGEIYERSRVPFNYVFNMVSNMRYNITVDEAEDAIGKRAIAVLPDDPVVKKSESYHIPAYNLDPNSEFSKKIDDLARFYSSRSGGVPRPLSEKKGIGNMIGNVLGRKKSMD